MPRSERYRRALERRQDAMIELFVKVQSNWADCPKEVQAAWTEADKANREAFHLSMAEME